METLGLEPATRVKAQTATLGKSANTVVDSPLFSPDLLSPAVAKALPPGYRLRALRRSDYASGFLDCLRVLTTVGDISRDDFDARFDWMARQDASYFVIVIEDTSRVVATGALFVERKLLQNLARIGHIEDIAVSKDQQGKRLGLRLIQALDFIAERLGCSKSILDCGDTNEDFYVKCGFRRAGLQMAHCYEDAARATDSTAIEPANVCDC